MKILTNSNNFRKSYCRKHINHDKKNEKITLLIITTPLNQNTVNQFLKMFNHIQKILKKYIHSNTYFNKFKYNIIKMY